MREESESGKKVRRDVIKTAAEDREGCSSDVRLKLFHI